MMSILISWIMVFLSWVEVTSDEGSLDEILRPTVAPTFMTAIPTSIPCSIIVRVCLDLDDSKVCGGDDTGILLEDTVELLVNNEIIYGPKNTGTNGYASFPGFGDEYTVLPSDENTITLNGFHVLNRGEDSGSGTTRVSVLSSNTYTLQPDDFLIRSNGACAAWIQWPIPSCQIIVLVCLDEDGDESCDSEDSGIEDRSVELSVDSVSTTQDTGPNGYTTFDDEVTYPRDEVYEITVNNLEGYSFYAKEDSTSGNGKKVWVLSGNSYTVKKEDFFIRNNGQCVAQIQFPVVSIDGTSSSAKEAELELYSATESPTAVSDLDKIQRISLASHNITIKSAKNCYTLLIVITVLAVLIVVSARHDRMKGDSTVYRISKNSVGLFVFLVVIDASFDGLFVCLCHVRGSLGFMLVGLTTLVLRCVVSIIISVQFRTWLSLMKFRKLLDLKILNNDRVIYASVFLIACTHSLWLLVLLPWKNGTNSNALFGFPRKKIFFLCMTLTLLHSSIHCLLKVIFMILNDFMFTDVAGLITNITIIVYTFRALCIGHYCGSMQPTNAKTSGDDILVLGIDELGKQSKTDKVEYYTLQVQHLPDLPMDYMMGSS
uniref:G-protein coupled receptors family 3 profile domain-containing protein n=1 Tax=Aureoumbra lagunensis TaxID=44058 RepID=A0A7S3JYA9_9STRA|mmetsp:Transcript_14927/g.18409  ORF Transcript_14927/g.18409 Transcript_14927/m.18409 type:complete len:601 (-) Transcript_14927:873-2675(-)